MLKGNHEKIPEFFWLHLDNSHQFIDLTNAIRKEYTARWVFIGPASMDSAHWETKATYIKLYEFNSYVI